jgi:hypothetical protein
MHLADLETVSRVSVHRVCGPRNDSGTQARGYSVRLCWYLLEQTRLYNVEVLYIPDKSAADRVCLAYSKGQGG